MGWLFRSKAKDKAASCQWALDRPIVQFGEGDAWTIGDSFQGCQIFGATGSGKSTGSLAQILIAMLQAGYGGVLFTCKPQDTKTYASLCEQCGRGKDVIVFGPGTGLRFNSLDAELRRMDRGAGQTQSVVTLLMSLQELSQRGNSGQGGEDNPFWQRTTLQYTRNTVDLLVLAKGAINTSDLYRIMISAPTSFDQLQSEEWRKQSYCIQCICEADDKTKDPSKRADLELVTDYFLNEWPGLAERTRSIIQTSLTSMLDVLNRGVVRDMTSGTSNVWPEMVLDGSIFIIDLPIKLFGDVGVFVQGQWKYCIQQMLERRDTTHKPRPVFLVADESHLLAVKQDQLFQTTARSSRAAVVYATQSISNYLAAFGNDSESLVHSLLGNLQTQIFHQQADIKTNQYASELIGRIRQYMFNSSSSSQTASYFNTLFGLPNSGSHAGMSEIFEFEVQPSAFAELSKGGPPAFTVDGILYQGGRMFKRTGRPWRPVRFQQWLG